MSAFDGQHEHDWTDHDAHSHDADADQVEEQKAFFRCLAAFTHYKIHSLATLARRRRHYAALPSPHKLLLRNAGFEQKLDHAEQAVLQNFEFIKYIVAEESPFPYDEDAKKELSDSGSQESSESDMDRVRSTIRQVVRDWSAEGRAERDATYTPIMEALDRAYAYLPPSERHTVRVLVPGAGLGRLCYEIAKRGYSSQGNEFSFYMLLTSNFLLNRIQRPRQHVIHPWVHSFSHAPTAADTLAAVHVPDEVPGNLPAGVDFSMVAGDFIDIYGGVKERGQWDCVVTCFFLDTARNVCQYMDVIHSCLVPGGVWINLGPLLYHFEGSEEEPTVELSLEEVQSVASQFGFVFEESRMLDATYAHNPRSIMAYVYRCGFWVARKPGEEENVAE
ncbi:N2227-domain-containing protein [Gonapodya prolifera JEL478]|uniref:carnosine N-methyltransferase n=1 Tax=Gonapodya prolifera (strain JEL478) TaxID=1344416 RepID=A0A139ALD3_GONPJ|nr:N2227-domain-containing protein [Gonapodya prolifera JEL478]|eukprot:KXS17597.1 N2227-domain-containing protein [Gonapodya prolifera JEL478]